MLLHDFNVLARLTLLAFVGTCSSVYAKEGAGKSTIFIASDSTAQDYQPEKLPQMGWGMVLKCSFDGNVRIDNRAQGGRSARSFREEGWMKKIEESIAPGDTLLIQFGHNDSWKASAKVYSPIPGFKRELLGYVDMARRHEAVPVLVTPVSKAQFGWDTLYNSMAEYSEAVRQVSASSRTPLIDLNADSQAALIAGGKRSSSGWYLPDNTHFTESGARTVAALIALRLGALGLPVSSHVQLSTTANAAILGRPDCPARDRR